MPAAIFDILLYRASMIDGHFPFSSRCIHLAFFIRRIEKSIRDNRKRTTYRTLEQPYTPTQNKLKRTLKGGTLRGVKEAQHERRLWAFPDIRERLHLVILLFFFQFSFFLCTKLGLFLVFPFAFIPFSLITHICFSSLKNDLRQLCA